MIHSPISLLSLQTISGTRLYYATAPILAPALLSRFDVGGIQNAQFSNGLIQPPSFKFTDTLTTSSATAVIENLSGNTVERLGSRYFATEELWGSQFIYQLWSPAAESSLILVLGAVADVEDGGDALRLSLKDIGNWSEIKAPDCQISENCAVTFGSDACGSTSTTPCNNDWGSCSQRNRFKGVVTQWDNSAIALPAAAYAQPAPLTSINLRRPA
ncbi:hypothetical protein ACFQBQ_07555 [Granulicella cerasi]|uniref:Uncharacterized protein n=1 Tax=Granulicella cerasi TaxID=741063 RepID=A0ABW1ZA82_9BACT|nr:hypothetical protein [Granulicella cerasi]